MQKETITCQYVNEPKTPKGPGSIKDSAGRYWKCWQEILPQFTAGGTYEITYEVGSYKGKPDNTVLTVKPSAAPPVPQPRAEAKPAYQVKGYGSTDMATAERIFVAGMMNNYVGNPNTAVTDLTTQNLVALTNTFRQVWSNTFGGGSQDEEMQDEIQYK